MAYTAVVAAPICQYEDGCGYVQVYSLAVGSSYGRSIDTCLNRVLAYEIGPMSMATWNIGVSVNESSLGNGWIAFPSVTTDSFFFLKVYGR